MTDELESELEEQPFEIKPYLGRALAWVAGLILVVVLTPLDDLIFGHFTAWLVNAMLSIDNLPVVRHGAELAIGDMAPRAIVGHWTAAPVWLVGLGFIIPYPTSLKRKMPGALLVLVNTVLINAMVIGWLIQSGESTENGAGLFDLLVPGLRRVYPPVMTIVLVVTMSYWMARVVPEGRPGHRGHQSAREVLGHAAGETSETDE